MSGRRGRSALAAAALAAVVLAADGPAAAGEKAPVRARRGAATLWERAAAEPEAAAYRAAMRLGDSQAARAASLANRGYQGRAVSMALRAVAAYETAIKADPTQGEPHYRAAEVLYGHFVSELHKPDVRPAQRAIAHWDEFEKKSPQDPRMEEMLFRRGFTCTKLGGEEMFRRAVADYEAQLRLLDAATAPPREMANVLSNKAEIHMALGELDQALTHYYQALEYAHEPLYAYGLAVALDRDGQLARAREVLASYKFDPHELHRVGVFFIPEGDIYWYESLGHESLGRYESAANYMRRYLTSQPRSPYAARARESLKSLEARARAGKGGKGESELEIYQRTWILTP